MGGHRPGSRHLRAQALSAQPSRSPRAGPSVETIMVIDIEKRRADRLRVMNEIYEAAPTAVEPAFGFQLLR